MKSFKAAPCGVQRVARVLCFMFETVPKIPKKTNEVDELVMYWNHAVKNLLKPDLITRLRGYPKEDQKQSVVDKVRLFVNDPEFESGLIIKSSKAAGGLADWARAIIQFHDALHAVKPC